MKTRWWVTTIVVLAIVFTLVAAYTAFAATRSPHAPGTYGGMGQMMRNITPAQRGRMQGLREKMMGSFTQARRQQMEAQCDKIRGKNGETVAPSAGAGTGKDINL